MTPVILASGTQRRASLGMAAAVAVEGAVLTGAGTLLAEVGERAQRRHPTLFAAPAARRIEEAMRRAEKLEEKQLKADEKALERDAKDLADD